jgi:hypothetical protein
MPEARGRRDVELFRRSRDLELEEMDVGEGETARQLEQ